MELQQELGARPPHQTRVALDDLCSPCVISCHGTLVYTEKSPGQEGPVGISGVVLSLLSGGIDSPVAAYRMMKRGCRVIRTFTVTLPDRTSQQKARQLRSG
jgi:thiamine biosynthesis protein ThiI